MKKSLFSFITFFSLHVFAQGTWTPLNHSAPDYNGGVMLLLSDGTVIAKTYRGGTDSMGVIWDRLKPDTTGSYVNGTWDTIAPMHESRLYFSSQVLKDGRVYVAGGEYGTGGSKAEIYNPLTNTWTYTPTQGSYFGDANSSLLPDGRILQALLSGSYNKTTIFNPVTNTWSGSLQTCHGGHDEASWVKLPDNSVLFVDIGSKKSERYIPSLNQWVLDANVPDSLYDPHDLEMGPGFLLPDGRAFFIGGLGHTALYTPSGNTTAGSWVAGPDVPLGYACTDAAGAMMVDGKILFAASPKPRSNGDYPSPTAYFEYDYWTNSYTQVTSPLGIDTLSHACYVTNMLDLPDGNVLYADQGDTQYYVYTPAGAPQSAGMPTIGNIAQLNCDTFRITGTLFNGISEGAEYGDDWQMASNYPIIRLSSGPYVYYARSFNWNRTGVQTGSLADTTFFTLPAGLQPGTYSLEVVANGIASSATSFVYSLCSVRIAENNSVNKTSYSVFPNPAQENTTIFFKTNAAGNYTVRVVDMFGRVIKEEEGAALIGENYHLINFDGVAKGVYTVSFQKGTSSYNTKFILK